MQKEKTESGDRQDALWDKMERRKETDVIS